MYRNLIDITEIINNVLETNRKVIMNLADLRKDLPASLLEKLNVKSKTSMKKFAEILEPHLENNFSLTKRGSTFYIAQNISKNELLIKIINSTEIKTPKNISRLIPFTKEEFSKILNELLESGIISVIFDEKLDVKIQVNKNSSKFQNNVPKNEIKIKVSETNFLNAVDELDKGKIFVRICDLRKKLQWTREDFDNILKTLRDKGTIQLHQADATEMTDEEIENSFIDENNYRLGMVIRNDK